MKAASVPPVSCRQFVGEHSRCSRQGRHSATPDSGEGSTLINCPEAAFGIERPHEPASVGSHASHPCPFRRPSVAVGRPLSQAPHSAISTEIPEGTLQSVALLYWCPASRAILNIALLRPSLPPAISCDPSHRRIESL